VRLKADTWPTAPYNRAFSQYDRTTVSRRLNEKLIEYGLCEKYGALAETYESRFSTKERCTLEELAKEKERQKALQDYVTNTPKNQTTIPV